jgi:tetratricopeptide (TPR) repeat protein
MVPERQCEKCGRKIPWGQQNCPFCPGHKGFLWSLRRDTFLSIVFVFLIFLFVVTGFVVRVYHDVEKGYAQEWYIRGEDDLRAGNAASALTDFRTALTYSRDNQQYQLRLAQALLMPGVSNGSGSEARTYLLNLLEREPGNGTVNLELARLAARNREVPEALRYYHGAIYGEWNDDQVGRRTAVRLELVEFLLGAGQKDSARAELIALSTDLPPDPELQTRVGMLLLQVKGYDDALKLFHRALLEKPNFPAALAGAGECHFYNGEYTQAERYLSHALEQDPHMTQAEAMLDTVQSVLNNDPFGRRMRNKERARRAILDFNTAFARLQSCATQKGIDLKATGGDPLQTLYTQATGLQPRVDEQDLNGDSELLAQTMDAVFEIEQASAHACGEPKGTDQALLLLAREQGGVRP